MRVLVLSAYDAASHRRWHRHLRERLADFDWRVLTLPPRHFRWRIRGNSLWWAVREREVLCEPWDVVVATSMVDLSALRGFVPSICEADNLLYFHENQFAYPKSSRQHQNQSPAVVNLYAAACADRIAFNSTYNLCSFLDGARAFLDLMPDHAPASVVERIEAHSRVIPVPLSDELFVDDRRADEDARPLSIVWNHRWEYDKAPERFFRALFELSDRECAFRLHVLGQRFRSHPEIFDRARQRLADHIDTFGYVEDRDEYLAILADSDLVVSTSLHEFQGLAMLEAIALGCRPLAPDRLAYPDYVPERWRFSSFPEDAEREVAVLADRLAKLCDDPATVRNELAVDVNSYAWSSLEEEYREWLANG
ncbi:MAG: tRNA-queuosine alpha-mannosyltransferase domain-containing protein [Persicimonas sp.]